MAEIKPTPLMDKIVALECVKLGTATPGQQKLAHEFMLERIESEKEAAKKPVKQNKQLYRNITIYLMLKTAERCGEAYSQKQACHEEALRSGLKPDTVEREYRKWNNGKSEAQKQKEVDAFISGVKRTYDLLLG